MRSRPGSAATIASKVERLITMIAWASRSGATRAHRTSLESVVSASCRWQTVGRRRSREASSHQGIVTVLTYTASGPSRPRKPTSLGSATTIASNRAAKLATDWLARRSTGKSMKATSPPRSRIIGTRAPSLGMVTTTR